MVLQLLKLFFKQAEKTRGSYERPYAVLPERKKIWSEVLKETWSEIPCLVTGLPASGATPMENPAYNGGARTRKRG